jgi:hypothetical protein
MTTQVNFTVLRLLAALAGFLITLPAGARAATLTVTNAADSGPGTLRQLITSALAGDTINFAVTGTVTLTSGQLSIGKNLTLSGPGPSLLTLSGNNASRIFQVTAGTVTLSGLTLTRGRTTGAGGAILNSGGTLTVSRCVLSSNYAALEGGSMRNASASLPMRVNDCFIYGNRTDQGGGAMCSAGPLTNHQLHHLRQPRGLQRGRSLTGQSVDGRQHYIYREQQPDRRWRYLQQYV